jgi:tetratricopeptide (TPR) repeat protein
MLLKTEDIRGCETLFEKAVATHMAGDLKAAETMYREILDRDPVNAAVIHNLGLISFQGGDLSKAARFFETALDYFSCFQFIKQIRIFSKPMLCPNPLCFDLGLIILF